MERVVLLSGPGRTWKQWHAARPGIHRLIADPAETLFDHLGRLALLAGEERVGSRFFGWLNPLKAPAPWLAALSSLLQEAPESIVIQLPPYRPGPAALELVHLAIDLIRPDRICLDSALEIPPLPWPLEPERLDLPPSHEPALESALRKAYWLKLFQQCELHEAPIAALQFRGARLGSGHRLSPEFLASSGLGAVLHAELCGQTLLLIAEAPLDDADIGRLLDLMHATKAVLTHPSAYEQLVCMLLDHEHCELGMGVIERLDFAGGAAHVFAAAVAPAPIGGLRLGGLRLDRQGREIGEAKLWEL